MLRSELAVESLSLGGDAGQVLCESIMQVPGDPLALGSDRCDRSGASELRVLEYAPASRKRTRQAASSPEA